MFKPFTLTLVKKLTVFFLAFLLLAVSFGLSYASMGMDMGTGSDMTDCPFMPGVSICNMNPLEMLGATQSFFSNVTGPQDQFSLLSLAYLALFALPYFLLPAKPRLKYKVPKGKLLVCFNFLEEAFASGVLNPKLF